MTTLYPEQMLSPCRACGAVRAIASGKLPDVCESCWNRAAPSDADDFNRWLARKLLRDLKRLRNTGVIGRCEAITNQFYGHKGRQCASVAVAIKDGRRVCQAHRNSEKCKFIDNWMAVDQYEMLRRLVRDLASVDDRFRSTVAEAIQ